MERDEVDARVLDLELEAVNLLVDCEDLPRDLSVEPCQGVDRLPDRELAELGEGHHVLVQFQEPLLERFPFCGFRHYPNLPVMQLSVNASFGLSTRSPVGPTSMRWPRSVKA